ncbi:MAG: hypothetical protein QG558_1483 [Campylobacterota bacterium]|nr:hypothetical protein [Campylobacterota bacterium]
MMISENFLPDRGLRYSVTAAQRSNMGFLETIPSGNAEFLFIAGVAYTLKVNYEYCTNR